MPKGRPHYVFNWRSTDTLAAVHAASKRNPCWTNSLNPLFEATMEHHRAGIRAGEEGVDRFQAAVEKVLGADFLQKPTDVLHEFSKVNLLKNYKKHLYWSLLSDEDLVNTSNAKISAVQVQAWNNELTMSTRNINEDNGTSVLTILDGTTEASVQAWTQAGKDLSMEWLQGLMLTELAKSFGISTNHLPLPFLCNLAPNAKDYLQTQDDSILGVTTKTKLNFSPFSSSTSMVKKILLPPCLSGKFGHLNAIHNAPHLIIMPPDVAAQWESEANCFLQDSSFTLIVVHLGMAQWLQDILKIRWTVSPIWTIVIVQQNLYIFSQGPEL
ncbi:hypothetical protein B0H10DRAFT_1954226 [Mycena sp. CBHHK59/15]|nr:hypothetical protein B0H10DRAFT_1954226 [Mycena sp. CBHHK59/15]